MILIVTYKYHKYIAIVLSYSLRRTVQSVEADLDIL
jgi:hypothetical protein